jgi:two-component system phosphate regulon sensor histidine kinase PhoR
MRLNSFFPVRLFSWFLSQQILFSGLLFVGLDVTAYFWLGGMGLSAESLQTARFVLLTISGLAFLITILVSVIMARRLVIPLGRLIEKTRRLREFPFEGEESEPEALTFDEPGEWYELERALNRLGRDLRHKTIRLSREKTELRAIMAAVSEAVLAINADRRLLFYNPQFAYLFNLKGSSAASTNPHISELLRSDEVLATYDQALAGESARRELQISVSGERLPRHFQLSVAPLRKKHNQEIYGAAGIFHDITELKRAERIRIDFVGNVSHELRTPLTTINGYLQTLAEDFAKERYGEAKEFLQIVAGNAMRLKNLVEDLLDLSALESGKELAPEYVSVQDVTEAVLRQVHASGHRIHLQYDVQEVWADPKRLEQVLRNLMENAVRYVPEGRNIEVRWLKNEAQKVELRVKDDGPGIAPQHLARLFERFYRVDEARARTNGGTGIGLSLVKHIVQRHGGQVRVSSQLGQGSEFVCEFPLPR